MLVNIHELSFCAGEIVEKNFYFSNSNMNGLFQMDLESENLSFVGYFEENPVDAQELHTGSFLYKEWICFVPRNAKGIDVYNWKTGEFKCIHFNNEKEYYVNAIRCGNLAWFIPVDISNPIFSLNLDMFSVCTYPSPLTCMKSREIIGRLYRIAYLDRKIYAAIFGTKYVFCFYTDTQKMEILDIGINDLCAVNCGANGLWFLKEHGKELYYWETKSNKKRFFQCHVDTMIREDERIASFILETENDIYMFPGRMTDSIMKFNKERGTFEGGILYPDDLIWRNPNRNYFQGYTFYDGKYYIYPINANYIFVIDNRELKFIKLKQIDIIDGGKVFKNYLYALISKSIVREQQLSLNEFWTAFTEYSSIKEAFGMNVGKQIMNNLFNRK